MMFDSCMGGSLYKTQARTEESSEEHQVEHFKTTFPGFIYIPKPHSWRMVLCSQLQLKGKDSKTNQTPKN